MGAQGRGMVIPTLGDRLAIAERERAVAEATGQQLSDQVVAQAVEIAQTRSQRDGLLALLREVEWKYPCAGGVGSCYFCDGVEEATQDYLDWAKCNDSPRVPGHAPDCRLHAALDGRDG